MTNKQIFKRFRGKCFFCLESTYELLTVHRILEGCNKGKYNWSNSLCICQNCHARIHYSKEIVIDKKYKTSGGKMVVHYWINEQEFWTEDC